MKKVKLAVLLSGGGTTLGNFIDKIAAGELSAEIVCVISSREDVYGLVRADKAGIPHCVIPSKDYRGKTDELSGAVNAKLDEYAPDLIAMAGFMLLWKIPERYLGKVMNIHPGLIPSFCGHKMYGRFVHEAVVAYGTKVSGCTVHFADNEYDAGPVIIQRSVPVYDTDTPDDVAHRVFEQECIAYPEAINLFAAGRLEIDGRIVRIKR